jgi:hypothetical protein
MSYIVASSWIGLRRKARWRSESIWCCSSSDWICLRSRTSPLTNWVFGNWRRGGLTSTITISSVSSRPERSSIVLVPRYPEPPVIR